MLGIRQILISRKITKSVYFHKVLANSPEKMGGVDILLVHELTLQGPGNKTALYEKNNTYTYSQLQNNVAGYREQLYALGVRKSDNVAILAKNCAEYIFAYMAIISLGGVAVPLNTMLTPREIVFILEDAAVKHVITDRELQIPLEYKQVNIFSLNMGDPAGIPEIDIKESDPCVILYTSGTTGRPKGALLSHKNLITNTIAIKEVTETGPDDNVLCVLPMFHSFALVCCIKVALYNGASLTIVEGFSPKEVIATIRDAGVTTVFGVPAMYSFYTALATPEDLAGVRLFVSGASSLPLEIINRFYNKTKQRVIEGYGLSEASPRGQL